MQKYLLACSVSAMIGASLVTVWNEHQFSSEVSAQERQQARRNAPANQAPVGRLKPVRTVVQGNFTPDESVNIAVYESTNRSVVNINTRSTRTDNFFFVEVPSEGSGSGSVLDHQGHILTNFHVVDGAQSIDVTLASGKTYPAALVGRSTVDDIAVLKIQAPREELFPVHFGDSASLRVGQKAYAIGNPFGLERTLTTGIISSLNRSIPSRSNRRVMKSIIQIDAAMNPGNSGGPLLNTSGQVIGMNTAIASKTGQNTGVGFAIPANRIKRVVPELILHGRITRPDAGISRVMQTEKGLLIASVIPGSPADTAGLRGFRIVRRQQRQGLFVYESQSIDRSTADLMIAIDGQPIRTVDEFLTYVEDKKPGDTIRIKVIRSGKETEIPLKLGAAES